MLFRSNCNLFCPYKYYNFVFPKRDNLVKQYGGTHITRGNDTFDFQMNKEYDNDDNNNSNSSHYKIKIFIGNNKKRICLTGLIEPEKPNEIYLEAFGYYNECSMNEKLKQKTGTQNMMYAFIEYLQNEYPNVECIILDDKSVFYCNDVKIPTYPYYLFKYGSSYYEHNFNFHIIDPLKQSIHNENIKKSKNIRLNNNDFINNS